jgi:hypothetical protein
MVDDWRTMSHVMGKLDDACRVSKQQHCAILYNNDTSRNLLTYINRHAISCENRFRRLKNQQIEYLRSHIL